MTAAQVLRFERTLERLADCKRGDLAELALTCGYAGQADTGKEFRRFVGWSPTEYPGYQVPDGGAVET